ncbi:MAG: hypothetical protein MZV70_45430 [Desulfobacterales bacterium]|nr:hypothetical protein [Desulfobacterales bacterium]
MQAEGAHPEIPVPRRDDRPDAAAQQEDPARAVPMRDALDDLGLGSEPRRRFRRSPRT